MGQEFADATGELGRQAVEDVLEIGVGVVAVEAGGLDEAHDGGRTLPGPQTAGEEPVVPVIESFG